MCSLTRYTLPLPWVDRYRDVPCSLRNTKYQLDRSRYAEPNLKARLKRHRWFTSGLELPPGMPGISPALVGCIPGSVVGKAVAAGDAVCPLLCH